MEYFLTTCPRMDFQSRARSILALRGMGVARTSVLSFFLTVLFAPLLVKAQNNSPYYGHGPSTVYSDKPVVLRGRRSKGNRLFA